MRRHRVEFKGQENDEVGEGMKPTDQDEDDRLQRVGRWSVLLMFFALLAAHLVARYLPLDP